MEAILFSKHIDSSVQCNVCEHHCLIKVNHRGICGVRENRDGILYVLNYVLTVARQIDPIEKKPLYHFLPNTDTYSVATVGCNMHCEWCQNHRISQQPKPHKPLQGIPITPKEHVDTATRYGCPSISYTYTEPTIYLEYALDIMKIAHMEGLQNVWVTNGFMSKESLELILPYLDAANIDYKSPITNVYRQYCSGDSKPVLRNIKTMYEQGVHVEITTLLIPGINDDDKSLHQIAEELAHISPDIVWHISRFFPAYHMKETPVTPLNTMKRAKQIGEQHGLTRIYLGNI